MTINVEGLGESLKVLESLPSEMVSKRGGPVRRALAKAARTIRDPARKNLRASLSEYNPVSSSGQMIINSGLTAKNVVSKLKRMKGGEKGEWYTVTVAYKPHPNYPDNRYRGKQIKFNDIAFFVENGTSKQPARPWLRPAYEQNKEKAVQVFDQDLAQRLNILVAQLESKYGAR